MALATLECSKGRWAPEDVIKFVYMLEDIRIEELEDEGEVKIFSLVAGGKDAEQES